MFGVLLIGLSAWLVGCGKAPVTNPGPRATVIGVAMVSPALSASRLVSAGCVQIVRFPDKKEVVEFSSVSCPVPASGILPEATVVFRVDVEPKDDRLVLRHQGASVGLLSDATPAGAEGVPVWLLAHLCQISDPTVHPDPLYSELCRVDFETDGGEKQGRYRSLRITPLEELAALKIAEMNNLRNKQTYVQGRLAAVEREQEMARREMLKAQAERSEALESLAEAQRGVRDSVANNLTVNRRLERKELEAQLEYAKKDARISELRINAANRAKDRAADLASRVENSDRAKLREDAIQKKLDYYRQRGESDGEEARQVQAFFDQNRALILSDEERRKLEELITFANAEAEKIKDLTEERRAAQVRIIERTDDLVKLDGQPPPTKNINPIED